MKCSKSTICSMRNTQADIIKLSYGTFFHTIHSYIKNSFYHQFFIQCTNVIVAYVYCFNVYISMYNWEQIPCVCTHTCPIIVILCLLFLNCKVTPMWESDINAINKMLLILNSLRLTWITKLGLLKVIFYSWAGHKSSRPFRII